VAHHRKDSTSQEQNEHCRSGRVLTHKGGVRGGEAGRGGVRSGRTAAGATVVMVKRMRPTKMGTPSRWDHTLQVWLWSLNRDMRQSPQLKLTR